MTTENNYISGAEIHKVTEWPRSGGPDTRPTPGDDREKIGDQDPQTKESGDDITRKYNTFYSHYPSPKGWIIIFYS
jgi:hypothetical protein